MFPQKLKLTDNKSDNNMQAHIRCYGAHVLNIGDGQLGNSIVSTLCKNLGDLSRQIVHRRTNCLAKIVNPATRRTTFS